MSVFKDLIAAITAISLSDDETKLVPLSVAKQIVSNGIPEDPSMIGSVVVKTGTGSNVSPALDFNTDNSLMGIYTEGSHQPIINRISTGPALYQNTISFGNAAAKTEILGTSLDLPAEVTSGGISLVRKYTTTVGDGVTTSFLITHNLGFNIFLVQATVHGIITPFTITHNDGITMTITFTNAPDPDSALILIIG